MLASIRATKDFNPRPPRGGRPLASDDPGSVDVFQSTPSARRATGKRSSTQKCAWISIHALREEGDAVWDVVGGGKRNFNPRPPRGGRPRIHANGISIHALREEGDLVAAVEYFKPHLFQSTPSARRATTAANNPDNGKQ